MSSEEDRRRNWISRLADRIDRMIDQAVEGDRPNRDDIEELIRWYASGGTSEDLARGGGK